MEYNTTSIFSVDKSDLGLVLHTERANKYWKDITVGYNNGLVSIPNTQTLSFNIPPSNLTTIEGESVYQVDVFHQIHCLERIRSDLLSAPFLYQLNPNRTDEEPHFRHIMHCVDYLRQAIMCTGDLTLVSSGSDLEFEKGPERQCRDFHAIGDWVRRWRWGYV